MPTRLLEGSVQCQRTLEMILCETSDGSKLSFRQAKRKKAVRGKYNSSLVDLVWFEGFSVALVNIMAA